VACTNSPANFNQNDKRIIKFVSKQLAISMNQHELLHQLKIKEINFHRILEDNIIGIFFGNRTGRITYANQAFLDMLEYSKKDLDEGQLNWKELTPVGQEQLDLQMLQEVTEKGRSLPIQAQYRTKNGQIVDVIRSTISFEGTVEDVTFVVDIRQLKRTEIDLLEKNRELEQFASIASHDLQAPLRKIKAFLDLLEQDATERLNDSDRDYIERVQNSASRMQQLIGDLLALARVTRRGQPFELVNMLDVFHEVVQDLAIEIAQLEAHVEIGDMFSVEADATQMYQLLQNLLTNSLKYRQADKPPFIRVWMQQTATNQVQLILEDNGIGFEQEKAEWIFGAFTRLGTDKEQKGTGIGLAICKKIVEHHGGKIWATSTPGNGAKFVVELPIHQTLAPVRLPYERALPEQSVID
jgi:PAS domain S-box-containing protein